VKLSIQIDAPKVKELPGGKEGQFHRNALSAVLKDMAARISGGGALTGDFDRGEIRGHYAITLD
jgi:hypothetical protein